MHNLVKKGISIAVTTTTILWSVGAGFAPLATQAAVAGDLIKMAGNPAVYYLGGDNKRYVFPNSTTYFTWYSDFSGVVTVSQSELQSYAIGGNVTMRPGTKLAKITTDPKVYAIEPGGKLRWVESEAVAGTLYGSSWAQRVVDVPDAFFVNYTVGSSISTNTYPTGSLIKNSASSDVYYVDGTSKRMVTSAGLTANKLNSADILTANDTVFGALSTGSQITGADSTIWNVAGAASQTPTGNLAVTLAADSPVSMTLVAGQARADLAHFTFSGTGTVTNLTLERIGLSSDSTLSALYLYDGATRLTDSASVSSSTITFNNSAGLFAVSGTKTISVQANVATGTSGQTTGVKVTGFKMGSVSGTGTAMGSLHSIATVTDLATVNFNSTTTPATSTISPQTDYVVWQNVTTVGSRTVNLSSISLRQIGSVNTGDINNFRFYVDGVQKGATVQNINSNGYVVFDLTGTPAALTTGSRQLRVLADVIGGSSRTFSFSLQQAGDAQVVDSQYNVAVLPTANRTTFSARTSGTQTVDTGSLTFTKRTDSPSGNITISASNQVYGRFDVKAYGEQMKVESLQVAVVESDTEAVTLRNGALYLDGVQVGSTTAISDSSGGAAPDYTEYTFGSSFVVTPGTPRVLEIRADVYDSDGTDNIEDADTHQIRILAGSTNVQRLTSLGYGSYPAALVNGNSLTISVGALTVAKNTSIANHSVVVPKTAYKIGSYTIQANTTESATITSLVIDFDEDAGAFLAASDLSSMYVTVGAYTSPVKSTVTATANTFTTNLPISTGQVLNVDVYADVASGASDGGTDDTGETSLTVSYTTTQSSTSTSATEADGQTITYVQSGTFSTALGGSSPLIRIVAGNQTVTGADFEFTAVNETYYLAEIQVKVGSAAIASVVNTVQLYDGATPIGSATPLSQATNTAALITGLQVPVVPGTPKVITAKLNLNSIGAGAGTSGSNAALSLDYVTYADSNGVLAQEATDRDGNALYVYRTIPTATFNSVSTSNIVNGAQYDLYSFNVLASTAAALNLKQIKLSALWNDGGAAGDTLEIEQIKLYENGVDITDRVVVQDEDGNDIESTSGLLEGDGTLVISWAAGQQATVSAGGSNTYVIKGVPSGFNTTDASTSFTDSVTFRLLGDSAVPTASHTYLNGTVTATTLWGLHDSAAATGSGEAHNFIWSDGSANPHANNENADSSADWFNGYKVLNLDLNTVTWAKTAS